MVKINQISVGQKSSGTLDGITYVTRKGVTFAHSEAPANALQAMLYSLNFEVYDL